MRGQILANFHSILQTLFTCSDSINVVMGHINDLLINGLHFL